MQTVIVSLGADLTIKSYMLRVPIAPVLIKQPIMSQVVRVSELLCYK